MSNNELTFEAIYNHREALRAKLPKLMAGTAGKARCALEIKALDELLHIMSQGVAV